MEPDTNTSRKVRVLVVDDLPAVRESLRTVLSLEEDLEVVGEASSGLEAIFFSQTLQPDVVLLDLQFHSSKMDGIEICREIKQQTLAPKVLVLTIYTDLETRQRAMEAGCDCFIEKGAEIYTLLGQLRLLGATH